MQMSVLTNDAIRHMAPSAFAAAAHESRSARYAYIPTSSVINAMRDEGFYPVSAGQSRSRIQGKADFTKHMIRYRREDQLDQGTRKIGDVSAEVVMVNSHDGTSSYSLMSGLFRLWCLNGAVSKVAEFDSLKIPHSGKIVEKVIEGSYRVIDNSRQSLEQAKEWGGIELSGGEQLAFGAAAAAIRFDVQTQLVQPAQMVRARREEDRPNDLWTVFNRAQEALIRGGVGYISVGESGQRRRLLSRPVGSIDRNIGVNQAIWTLGAEMARLKGL